MRTIQPEDRISRYRVVGPLGSGGMGEVYLAHDQTLERSVALKVLPFHLVRDEERVRRFVREAKSASSLNHPNIVTIYEIGHERVHAAGGDEPVSDPIHFISMELVTGETLGDKIRSQKTDLKTLLGYLAQAAEGIAKAHSAGIVHRDLKPANIMISEDGYAKVLDFGLAKLLEREAVSEDLSADATVSHQTILGKALGTVGYMSPEQVRGSRVDHRSDIFSFGCVLYECVTRQRAFRADTDVETLHQILHQAPSPAEELNPDAPHALQRLINRCLARDPDRRLQSMKDLAIELQAIADEYETLPLSSGSSATVGSGGQPTVGGRRIPTVVLVGMAVVALVGLVLGINALLRGPGSERAGVSSPAPARVTGVLGDVSACVLSPDGKYMAYAAGLRGSEGLWIRQLATGSNVKLSAGTHGAIRGVSFSPDGNYVYFTATPPEDPGRFDVYQIPSLGGSPQRQLTDVDSRVSLSPDGRRACFRRGVPRDVMSSDLVIADLDTGEERVLVTAAGFPTLGSPAWSPSGKRIAAIQAGQPDTLVVIDPATGDYEPLGQLWGLASSCVWLPGDRGVIVTGSPSLGGASQVWRVSYPDGVVRRITGDRDSYTDVTVTADGTALSARREVLRVDLWSAPVAGAPVPRRLTRSSAGAGGMEPLFDVVDDGSIVVIWEGQLRLLDGEGTQIRSITNPPGIQSFSPVGSPGGILFMRFVLGEGVPHIWHAELAGGAPTRVTSGPGEFIQSAVVQNVFLYVVRGNGREVFIGSLAGREPRRVPGYWPCGISPDGRWVFTSEGPRIVVRSIETLEPQLEVSVGGAQSPVPMWTPESDAIAHVISAGESQQIVLQPLDGGEPRLLLEVTPARLDTRPGQEAHAYGWSPDGKSLCLKLFEDGVFNLWVVPSAGGELRPITDFRTGMIYWWEWARDSQSVHFTWGSPEQDAVLISGFE